MLAIDSPRWAAAAHMLRFATPLAVTLVAAGCAGHSIECLTGTGSKGCAPDTLGHQQMIQEQQGEETTATIDDARCRSIGPPGSAGYLACRSHAADVRKLTR